jgi:hypothetical protein
MSFRVGEFVKVLGHSVGTPNFGGIKFKVAEPNKNDPKHCTRLIPLVDRPDGYGLEEFLWTTANIEKW